MLAPGLDTLLVALIVALASLHVAWQMLPTVWRVPAAARLASRLEGSDDAPGALRWLLRALRAPSAGCGDCGGRARCPAQTLPAMQPIAYDEARLIARSRG